MIRQKKGTDGHFQKKSNSNGVSLLTHIIKSNNLFLACVTQKQVGCQILTLGLNLNVVKGNC